jgi:hypothetical protein
MPHADLDRAVWNAHEWQDPDSVMTGEDDILG